MHTVTHTFTCEVCGVATSSSGVAGDLPPVSPLVRVELAMRIGTLVLAGDKAKKQIWSCSACRAALEEVVADFIEAAPNRALAKVKGLKVIAAPRRTNDSPS